MFDKIANILTFGYHRPQLPTESFEEGWNLISQKEAIKGALKRAFKAGQMSAEKRLSSEELIQVLADLFDEIEPGPEEIDELLRDAGYDPGAVGARMKAAERTMAKQKADLDSKPEM